MLSFRERSVSRRTPRIFVKAELCSVNPAFFREKRTISLILTISQPPSASSAWNASKSLRFTELLINVQLVFMSFERHCPATASKARNARKYVPSSVRLSNGFSGGLFSRLSACNEQLLETVDQDQLSIVITSSSCNASSSSRVKRIDSSCPSPSKSSSAAFALCEQEKHRFSD